MFKIVVSTRPTLHDSLSMPKPKNAVNKEKNE
jgi:hypothetical protein